MTPDQIAEIKERVYCPSAIQAVQIGEYEACARAIVERDAQALVAEVERLSLIESNLVQEIVRTSFHTAEQVGADVAEMMPTIALMQTAEAERLQAAVDAVRELHSQYRIVHLYKNAIVVCESCSIERPCPTIRALDEHLGGGEG